MDFAVAPERLKDVSYEMRVNEDVLRWVVVRRPAAPRLPGSRAMFHRHPEFGPLLRPAHRAPLGSGVPSARSKP